MVVPGLVSAMLALFLDGNGYYVHWGFFQMSLANLLVIALMVAVFVAALVVPFPGHRRRTTTEEQRP